MEAGSCTLGGWAVSWKCAPACVIGLFMSIKIMRCIQSAKPPTLGKSRAAVDHSCAATMFPRVMAFFVPYVNVRK